jgi:hypothetical protein
LLRQPALHLTRRLPSARADLSSDKERLRNRSLDELKSRNLSIDLRVALDASPRE